MGTVRHIYTEVIWDYLLDTWRIKIIEQTLVRIYNGSQEIMWNQFPPDDYTFTHMLHTGDNIVARNSEIAYTCPKNWEIA